MFVNRRALGGSVQIFRAAPALVEVEARRTARQVLVVREEQNKSAALCLAQMRAAEAKQSRQLLRMCLSATGNRGFFELR